MSTQLVVDELLSLPDGTFLMRGTRIEGPAVEMGQRGESANAGDILFVEVVGTGVVDPNLDATGRQGLLLKVAKGDAADLCGRTLVFTPRVVSALDAPPH